MSLQIEEVKSTEQISNRKVIKQKYKNKKGHTVIKEFKVSRNKVRAERKFSRKTPRKEPKNKLTLKLQRSERIHLPDSFTTGQKSVKPLKIAIKPRNPSTRLRHPKSPSQPPKSFGHRKFFTGSLRDCSRLGKRNCAECKGNDWERKCGLLPSKNSSTPVRTRNKQRKEKITNRFFSVNDAYTPQVAADKSCDTALGYNTNHSKAIKRRCNLKFNQKRLNSTLDDDKYPPKFVYQHSAGETHIQSQKRINGLQRPWSSHQKIVQKSLKRPKLKKKALRLPLKADIKHFNKYTITKKTIDKEKEGEISSIKESHLHYF
ncbi:unnamed protein product [Moneuplotes crassus]|uniref:Uncharacterized protein n=1 Tax=Euplotes crassus TaxID=5936 RepID=A0AAD2DB13_EUPCR|nr:unnamed protein product [Moneuplotes crassus]